MTVTTATANRIAGTFSFTVPPGTVDPAASALEMTNGEFNVPVEGN